MDTLCFTSKVNNGTSVAIGKFDSIHLGHTRLIKKAVEYANSNGLISVVYTVKPETAKAVCADDAMRIAILKNLGVDMLCSDVLNNDYAKQSPEDFVKNILIDKLNAKFVAVGYNFKFGCNRMGDAKMLKRLLAQNGVECEIIDCVCTEKGDEPISTTRIKELLDLGEVNKIIDFLGRPYCVSGVVKSGKKLGNTIGFPTANLFWNEASIMPKCGVYLTRVFGDFGTYYGITNIGKNPTVSNTDVIKAETHIIDFNENVYGKKIALEFLKRIRNEKKFESIDALKAQLAEDLQCAKLYIDKI